MVQRKPYKYYFRVFLFLLSFWVIGVIFAIFIGFGWFFLFGSIRTLITIIPPLDRITRKFLIGEEGVIEAKIQSSASSTIFVSYIFRLIILLAWIGSTIFIFAKANFPLIELFRRL